MEQPDYHKLFSDYADAYERSLVGNVDIRAIRAFFAEEFIAAGTNGQVRAGVNDDTFEASLQKGYAFYKSIGTKSMSVERVEAERLYESHDKVRVFYRASYEKRGRPPIEIASTCST